MNYVSMLLNTEMALQYLKLIPGEYLKLLSEEERNLFVHQWLQLSKQMERVLTQESLFRINNLFYKYPALKKQFLGNLSVNDIEVASHPSADESQEEMEENLKKLEKIRSEVKELSTILAEVNNVIIA